MILVDGTRVRREIKREYEKVHRDLEKARAELNRFEQEDLPQYSRWFNRQFGALLTELRETHRRMHELQRIFVEVQEEMFFSGASAARAYARVKNRQQSADRSEDFDGAGEEHSGNGEAGGRRHSSDFGGNFEEDFGDFSGFGKRRESRRNTFGAASARLKDLYRALARRLHPDVQQEMTAQKQAWWHQAQTAYEKGDLEQLEVILSLCEIEDNGTTEKTSLSVLQRISAQLKKSLRQIKGQLAKYRREPAWNFGKRADLPVVAAGLRRQMEHDLRILKEQLEGMELEIAALASQSQRRRAPRSRRGVVPNPFEFFF